MSETEHERRADEVVDEGRITETDGVRVERSVRWLDEETLRVEFDVTSTLDHAVHVEIEELIPEAVPLDDVGFHGDYGWQNWYVEHEGLIAHRVDLDPGEELYTLYGVRTEDDFDAESFCSDPIVDVKSLAEPEDLLRSTDAQHDGSSETVESEAPSETEFDSDASEDSDATASTTEAEAAAGADAESPDGFVTPDVQPAAEESEAEAEPSDDASEGELENAPDASMFEESESTDSDVDADAESGALDDEPAVEDAADEAEPVADDESTTTEPVATTTDTEDADASLVDTLTREIEAGEASDDQLEALREALGASQPETRTSIDVRLQRVEGELNELAAYRSALQEFIDEHGQGRDILENLKAQHDDVEGTIDDVTDRLDSFDDRLDAMEAHDVDRLDDVQADLATVESQLEDLQDAHDGTARRAAANEETLDGVTRRVDDVDDSLSTVESRLDTETDALEERITELDSTVTELTAWQQRFVQLLDDLRSDPVPSASDDMETSDPGHSSEGRDWGQ